MKPRIPDSLEHAVTVIMAALGAEECGRIIGKSASLVRKASDPDQDFMLDLHQALALDAAYRDKTGGEPPLLRAYLENLDAAGKAREEEENVTGAVLKLQKDLGQAAEKASRYTDAGSEGGQGLSPNERIDMAESLDAIERTAHAAKESILHPINFKKPA